LLLSLGVSDVWKLYDVMKEVVLVIMAVDAAVSLLLHTVAVAVANDLSLFPYKVHKYVHSMSLLCSRSSRPLQGCCNADFQDPLASYGSSNSAWIRREIPK